MKFWKKCLLIIGLCIIYTMICNPVLADNPPDSGVITDSHFYQVETPYTSWSNTANHNMPADRIFIPNIATFNAFDSIKEYATFTSKGTTCPSGFCIVGSASVTMNNYSSVDGYISDISSGLILGTATKGWFVDMNNHLEYYIFMHNWNNHGLTGSRLLSFTPNILLDDFTPYYAGTQYIGLSGDNVKDVHFSYSGYNPTDRFLPCNDKIIEYSNIMWVGYNRIVGSVYDSWSFDRYNILTTQSYYSNITLQHWMNNSYITDFSDISSNDTPNIYIPVGKNVKLTVTNPVTGNAYTYYWTFSQEGLLDLLVSKGLQSNVPLALLENTNAQITYSGDYSSIGKVLWIWSKGSSNGIELSTKIYTLNQSNGTWEIDGLGVYDFYNQVMKQQLNFMYSDYDMNWTGAQHNSITIWVYDINNIDIGAVTKRIYVGSPYQSFIRTWIYSPDNYILLNARLFVYDNTDGSYQSSGEVLTTGSKINTSILGHSYTTWAILENYTEQEWCKTDALNLECNRVSNPTANYSVTNYGTDTLVLYMYPFAGTGNSTITFFVSDSNNIPIEGALVHANPGGATGLTNGVGTVSFTGLITGVGAQYSVSKDNWAPVVANYVISDGLYIHVILYPITPTITPTPTVTLITPSICNELGAGSQFYCIFELMGFGHDVVNLIFALIIIGIFFFTPLILTGSPMGGMVGGIFGFVISFAVGFIAWQYMAVVMIICGAVIASKIAFPGE